MYVLTARKLKTPTGEFRLTIPPMFEREKIWPCAKISSLFGLRKFLFFFSNHVRQLVARAYTTRRHWSLIVFNDHTQSVRNTSTWVPNSSGFTNLSNHFNRSDSRRNLYNVKVIVLDFHPPLTPLKPIFIQIFKVHRVCACASYPSVSADPVVCQHDRINITIFQKKKKNYSGFYVGTYVYNVYDNFP